MSARGDDDLHLVLAAREGDAAAFGALFDRWFDRVFDVSYRILRDRDLAAETAQDVFLVGWQQLADLRQPGSFGGWLLRMSRNRSLNRLEREQRSVALGDEETGAVIDLHHATPDGTTQVDDSEQAELLWAAAAALGERDASVLDLHLRHGFGAPEIAEALDVSTENAYQLLHRLKDRLGNAIRGWVLWANGSPRCDVLASVLGAAGIDAFGADTVRVISRHAKGCDACESRQAARLSPQTMFAAVPIVAVGPFLKGKAAAALGAQGVPMSGSEAFVAAGAGVGGAVSRPWVRRGVRSAAFVAAAAVVLIVAVTALAASVGDGTGDIAAPVTSTELPRPTSTTAEVTTTTEPPPDTTATRPPSPPPPPAVPPVLVDPSGTTTTSAPPPEILSFVVRPLSAPGPNCARGEEQVTYQWETLNTQSVNVAWSYAGNVGRTGQLPAVGTASACLPVAATGGPARTLLLTAIGPDASVTSGPTR